MPDGVADIGFTQENLDREIRQGEFLSGLTLHTFNSKTNELVGRPIAFAVVVAQDCDLLQDYDRRSKGESGAISSILLVEAEVAEKARVKIGGSDLYKRVIQNKDERYQFVQACASDFDTIGEGLPDLVLDFRTITSAPTAEVYNQIEGGASRRRTRLSTPYREHLQARLATYLARVAVPIPHRLIK